MVLVTAVAQFRFLAWELLHAAGMAKKTQKKKKVYYTHRSQEMSTCHMMEGTHGEASGSALRWREQVAMGENLSLVIF